MFGDSFFTKVGIIIDTNFPTKFSSPCLGILFSPSLFRAPISRCTSFSSPCLGILFSRAKEFAFDGGKVKVFVPMFGDSFFTIKDGKTVDGATLEGFRPHVWGFFFHNNLKLNIYTRTTCFRPHVWGFFFHAAKK